MPAQEARGSIAGQVWDAQSAVVPGAAVTVLNTGTGYTVRVTTNASGYFEVVLLNPGMYTVTAEAPGFKKSEQGNVRVSVAGRAQLEFRLELGPVSETVDVTAEVPLLDTTTASAGRLLDERQIMQLPFNDLNPFVLVALAPGMQWTGVPENRRPFDIRGTSAFNTAGGVGGNEYMIDGTPVSGSQRRTAFVPPSDAVEELRLESTPFDASYGHTSGATVNAQTRAGTNQFHGSLYDQHWQQRWNATPHFLRLTYEADVAAGRRKPTDPKQPSGRQNNFGGTAGGPIYIPKIFDGRNKAFFFFSYNGIYQRRGSTDPTYNVPAAPWRDSGDFSALQAIDPIKYTVYDPRSARLVNGRVVRDPFPGNRGVPMLNPVYQNYLKFYPMPNNPAGLVTAEGKNNYLASQQIDKQDFNSFINRFDYNLGSMHRLYGRWYMNHNLERQDDWTYETVPDLTVAGLDRGGKGAGADYIWIVDSRTTVNTGVNWVRFYSGNTRPGVRDYTPSGVGFPKYIDERAGDLTMLPQISFSSLEGFGASYPSVAERPTTGEFKIAATSIVRAHSIHYGYNERRYWFTSAGAGLTSGSYTFNQTYMRAADNTTTADNFGLEWAAFRMGLPSSITLQTNDSGYWTTRYRALYLQDEWRVNRRFTLQLGMRYEGESGFTERFDRMSSGEFIAGIELPITTAVQAAYAAAPLPELPAADFRVLGGTRYAGVDGSRKFNNGTHHFLPRVGVAVQLDSKTVMRGGYGVFYDTFNVNNTTLGNQYGYSQPTSTVVSSDLGLTFCCDVGASSGLAAGRTPLTNPFPVRRDGTRWDEPYRNALGSMAFAGRSFNSVPRDFSPPLQQRWRIGMQRQLGRDVIIDISYNGSWTTGTVNAPAVVLPGKYWATGNTRNDAIDRDLNTNVANPFYLGNLSALQSSDPALYNYLSTQSFFTSRTIQKQRLLRSLPQFSSLTVAKPLGRVRYNDMQLLAQKRFSQGFSASVAYTWVDSDIKDWFANEFDPEPSWRVSNLAVPHRIAVTAIWELPFGHGKNWLSTGWPAQLAGGWRISSIYQYQSGFPTTWANRFFYGDPANLSAILKHDETWSRDMHQWFDPSIAYTGSGPIPQGFQGFEGRSALQPGTYQVRMFPQYLGDLRADGIRVLDLKILREFQIRERLTAAVSLDALNAINHTNLAAPNTNPTDRDFGHITSQRGLSRVLQMNLRIQF